MRQQIHSQEHIPVDWGRAAHAPELPQRYAPSSAAAEPVDASHPADAASRVRASTPRAWLRGAVRVLRDAAIGIALITAIPLAIVAVSGDKLYFGNDFRERIASADRLRALMPAKDAAITPMQAGLAYRALQSTKSTDEFPLRDVVSSGDRVWKSRALTDGMFDDLRDPQNAMPMHTKIITRAARGVSASELAYLRAVAESPIWRDVERVANARAVDFIGGQFVLPFRADAFAPGMPTERFSDSKAMAHAAVSRAAYYVATGQHQAAEDALRTIIAYGFALIDNGPSTLDVLVGKIITDVGRDGLYQLYVATGQVSRAETVAVPSAGTRTPAASVPSKPFNHDAWEQRMLDRARDARAPIGLRFESLGQLAFSSCTSVRGVLAGPSSEVAQAYAEARTRLARYPSEMAYLDLLAAAPTRYAPPSDSHRSIGERLVIGAATVSSTVLQNPRIAACSRLLLNYD